MYFDNLSDKELKEFTQKGEEVLHVLYTEDFLRKIDMLSVWIYRLEGEYAITTELGDACGPIQSLEEALGWDGFAFTIQDFELSSTVLDKVQLKAIEKTFLIRMKEMAERNPSLIPKIDEQALNTMIEVHQKYPNFKSSELRAYLAPRSVYAGGPLDTIVRLTREKEYLKILFTYGIDTIQELMGYFLEQEEYVVCNAIHKTIMDHNELTNNNLCSIKELVNSSEKKSDTPEGI